MLARLSALVIWALVAATAVFWGLRLWARPSGVPANAVAVGEPAPRGDLTRLFGAAPVERPVVEAPPEVASRFRLLGVMAPRAGGKSAPRAADAGGASSGPGQQRYGVALIQVDGKPARAFAVGSKLDGELVLQSVSLRSASIGQAQGGSALKLELPALPPPATGTLGAATSRQPGADQPFRMQNLNPGGGGEPGQPDNFNAAPTE